MTPIMMLCCSLLVGGLSTSADAGGDDAMAWDGELQVFGALRSIFHGGQIGSMVELDTMLPNPEIYAVGALAELSGEITVVAGKTYLSYPDGGEGARTDLLSAPKAGATLLVAAAVRGWTSHTTRKPIVFEELDGEIAKLAGEAGLGPESRFPFLLTGQFEDLRWHVIDGRRLSDDANTHEDHRAAAVRLERDETAATLVGFYSTSDQGVFTHAGSATHLHCVVDEPLSAGHVDHVAIPAGTTIRFPLSHDHGPLEE